MSADSASLLRSTGRQISRADAEFLLAHLLDVRRHELYLGAPVPTRTVRRFRRMVAAAAGGTPVQYLVHSAPFLDLDLHVDRRVLIPRPETEELVTRALGRLTPSPLPRFLDFGTGSGCIAIALARLVPNARVTAVDASAAALNVARLNARRCRVARRVRFIRARSLADPKLQRLAGRLDLVIANPPYVPSPRVARLPVSVRDHEPKLALDGGPKGTSIVAMLLEQGPRMVRPGGLLALEIDWSQGRTVRRLAPGASVERDLFGRTRYAFLETPRE